MRIFTKNKEGFSLIEVLIAFVILAIGLLGLASLQIVSIRNNAFSSEMSYATLIAQQKIEELRNLDYTDAALSSGDHTSIQTSESGRLYTILWSVDNNSPTTDTKTITLSVQWKNLRQGSGGQAEEEQTVTTTLTTIISE